MHATSDSSGYQKMDQASESDFSPAGLWITRTSVPDTELP